VTRCTFGRRYQLQGGSNVSETRQSLNSHIFTACEIFPDGTALELIRDPSKADESRLLEWRGRVINVGTSVEHCGLRYVPIELEPSVSTAVRFPVRVSPREGVRDLFTATELLMGCYLGLSGPNLTLTVAWQLASWVYDVLAHAPVLWITASPQSATHVALQILGLIGRHSLRLAGVGRRELCGVPTALRGTLLLDASDLRATAENLIRSATLPGTHVVHRGVIDLFCPKVVLTCTFPSEFWRDSEIVRISLIPSTKRIEMPDPKTAEAIGQEFQGRFLSFRLHHFADLQRPQLKNSRLSPPLQDLAATLTAAVMGDKELEQKIVAALESQEDAGRSERSSRPDAIVIEAALFFAHKRGQSEVRSSEIAVKATAILRGRDRNGEISAENVGWTMKRLGVPTVTLSSAGNGIRLTDHARNRLHELAMTYDVLTLRNDIRRDCPCCANMRSADSAK